MKCIKMLTFLPLDEIEEMDKLGRQPAEPRKGDPRVRAYTDGTWR